VWWGGEAGRNTRTNAGSLHCTCHDKTVSDFGRDYDVLSGARNEQQRRWMTLVMAI
jgi:hypothetical protein